MKNRQFIYGLIILSIGILAFLPNFIILVSGYKINLLQLLGVICGPFVIARGINITEEYFKP